MTEEVLPQITLTGSGVDLDPAAVLAHALMTYQAGVRAEAEKRVLAGPIDLSADILSGILMEVAGGHLNLFRITAGVAFRVAIKRSRQRALIPISETEAAQQADDAAMNLGAYLAATSSNAVMDGYHLNVNLKVTPKEAARRAAHAFGLTVPQMRSVFKLKDTGVSSSTPGAWRSLIDRYVQRAFGMRVATLVDNSLRQVEGDAVQKGWEQALADGTIPVTATKAWFTALDERTCPVCAPMDKVSVPITDTFKLPDGNRVKGPPVHVNCRCAVELVYDPEEVSKAWDPKLHPRSENGEFGFKVKVREHDAEARANVDRLLANVNLNQVGLSAPNLQPDAGLAVKGPALAAPAGLSVAGLNVNGPAGEALEVGGLVQRTHALLGGQMVNLRRLNMTHQLQVAAVVADNVTHQPAPAIPRGQLEPIPNRFVAFASPEELNVQRYDAFASPEELNVQRYDAGDTTQIGHRDFRGVAQIEKPLRFVDRNDRSAVRSALDDAMADMDQQLRDDPYEEFLDVTAQHKDPGVVEAAADLRMEILAGSYTPKGPVRVSVAPEDAMEAWRSILSPTGSGYRSFYEVEAYDETGRTVGTARVTAATIAALTDTQDHFRPHVVVAPHGTWSTEHGRGATTVVPGTGHLDVTGPFRFERTNGVIVLTPDDGVYRRANPEN